MNESTFKRSNCDIWVLSFQDKTYNLPSGFLIGVVVWKTRPTCSRVNPASPVTSVSSCQSSQLRLMDRTRTEGSRCLFNMKPTRGQPVRTAGQLTQRMLGVKRLSTAFHSLGCFSVHCLDVFRNTIFYKSRSGWYLNKPLCKNLQHTDEIKLESL